MTIHTYVYIQTYVHIQCHIGYTRHGIAVLNLNRDYIHRTSRYLFRRETGRDMLIVVNIQILATIQE